MKLLIKYHIKLNKMDYGFIDQMVGYYEAKLESLSL
jgi:hypothetical protein